MPRARVITAAVVAVALLSVRRALEAIDEQISVWIDGTTDGLRGAAPLPLHLSAWRKAASRRLAEVARIASDAARRHAGEPTIDGARERVIALTGAIQELLDLIVREGERVPVVVGAGGER